METERESQSNLTPDPGLQEAAQALMANVAKAFVGKDDVIQQGILTLMANGHILLEDVPGVGKTLFAKAIARSIAGDFKRIQFTADLLPSDITGVTVFSQQSQDFQFRKGPIFANILLADEINRATPRTQSALLEAMEEGHVSVEGRIHSMDDPFFVIATQNPVELEGTYPLPFAQMDRFMTRLSIGYLDREGEKQVLCNQRKTTPLTELSPVMHCEDMRLINQAVRAVDVEDSVVGYIVDIVHATRANPDLEYGASPRGSLDLQTFSQANAFLSGRSYVLPDDVKYAARHVLPHRLIAKKGTRSVSLSSRTVIDHIVDSIAVPI